VNELDLSDVALLFKSLVVLPQDRLEKKAENRAKSNSSPSTDVALPKTPPQKQTNGEPEAVLPKEQEPSTVAQEIKGEYDKISPFVILTSPQLKEAYLTQDSAFQKIIQALDITQCINYMSTNISILDTPAKYACVWCIGLDKAAEEKAKNAKHPNLIVSPDIMSLSNNEDKKQMYLPLKAFITSNIDTISQLQTRNDFFLFSGKLA
jgi:hypothetical protein